MRLGPQDIIGLERIGNIRLTLALHLDTATARCWLTPGETYQKHKEPMLGKILKEKNERDRSFHSLQEKKDKEGIPMSLTLGHDHPFAKFFFLFVKTKWY